MRGFLAGYPGSYDRLKLCGEQHDDNEDGEKRRISWYEKDLNTRYSNYARGGDLCPYENEERRVRRRRKRASNNGTRLDAEDVKDGKVEERYRYYLPTMQWRFWTAGIYGVQVERGWECAGGQQDEETAGWKWEVCGVVSTIIIITAIVITIFITNIIIIITIIPL